MLVRYHSVDGVTAFGPLRETDGMIYHSPMDFVFVRGRLFGTDVNRDRLYVADTQSGIVTPVGPVLLDADDQEWRESAPVRRGEPAQFRFASGSPARAPLRPAGGQGDWGLRETDARSRFAALPDARCALAQGF